MEQAPLVYALVHALDRAITGEMVFRTPQATTHTVTFFQGAPVRVEPGLEGDRIGDDLIAMEHITDAALANALQRAKSSRRRLGELLVVVSAVEPPALTEALKLQTARRLALIANLPPESRFALHFSARVDPEPHAPWAPIDMLLATVRAWTDRTRMHGTLRWLQDRKLSLSPDAALESVMLTSRERAAVDLMKRDAPSLATLYETVGNGLSSLLYTLAVTRQFTFSAEHGAPMGRRQDTSADPSAPQVAAPIGPLSDIEALPPSQAPTAEVAAARVADPLKEPKSAPSGSRASSDTRSAVRPVARRPFTAAPRPRAPGVHSPTMSAEFGRAAAAARAGVYETAERILLQRCTEEDAAEPDFQAFAAWVRANKNPGELAAALSDLTFLLMSHTACESALYYRGLLLKRSGKAKAALRDFVVLTKANPSHTEALAELKALREQGES